jgi:hypothetical protein
MITGDFIVARGAQGSKEADASEMF